MRVKSRWNIKDKDRSLEEIAGALGFIVWRIAQNGVLELENKGYETETNKQRLYIMAEFIAYTIHVVDRLTFDELNTEERQTFITQLAMSCARHYQDNMVDAAGPGNYQMDFVQLLNDRMNEYSELDFEDGKPAFNLRRYFGTLVAKQMGAKHNKWVADQVMDVESPEILETLDRSMKNLFDKAFR